LQVGSECTEVKGEQESVSPMLAQHPWGAGRVLAASIREQM